MAQQEQVSERGTQAEDNAGHEKAREVFPSHQNFAAHRREEVVVKALLEHLAAEQVHEDRHGAEEDRQAQHVQLEDAGELREVLLAAALVPATRMGEECAA